MTKNLHGNCPWTGKPLSKPFKEYTNGEYYAEFKVDLLFKALTGSLQDAGLLSQ